MSELAIASAQISIMRDTRQSTKLTVVERLDSAWGTFDVSILTDKLAQAFGDTHHANYLVLYGHFTAEEIKNVFPRAEVKVERIIGLNNPALPFKLDIE